MPHDRSLRFSGFSLVEAMAAVAVVGIGLVVALYALRDGMEAQRQVSRRAGAATLARLKLAEISAAGNPIAPQSGSFDSPYADWTWTAETRPTDLQGLFRLQVGVTWPGRSSKRHLSVETLIPQR